jgi:hypothetical protein
VCTDPRLALERARVICQKYRLSAELQPLDGGEIGIAIVNPNEPRGSVLNTPEDIVRQLESELKREISCYPILKSI